MKKIILNLLIITILIGCKTKSTDTTDEKDINSKIEINITEPFKNRIKDTLYFYLNQEINIPPDLYKEIFNDELSNIDKAYLKEIKTSFDSLNLIIVKFKTIESDREKEYIDLHIFNYNWTLLQSLSIEYEMDWDLFSQEYKFLCDSIFEIYQHKGLSFENDSTVKTTLRIKIDKIKILDTLSIQVDTFSY